MENLERNMSNLFKLVILVLVGHAVIVLVNNDNFNKVAHLYLSSFRRGRIINQKLGVGVFDHWQA